MCSVLMLLLMCDIPKDKRDPTARIHMQSHQIMHARSHNG